MVATSTQTRGLDTFPTELLVEIFKHLDYVTIAARVRPTCRRFHAVIQTARDGALAYNMFRAPLQLRPPKHWHRRDIAWHPCISFLTIDIGASSNFTLKDIYIVHPSPTARRQNGIRLLDTDMLGDNISEPAVTWVRANYRLKIACKFWGKDDGAITVRDLMEGYLKTLNRWSGELPCYHRTCPSKMPLKACPKKHDQVQNLGKVFRLVD